MATPIQTFYPSLAVNLRVRFDEALHVTDMPDPTSVGDLVDGEITVSPGGTATSPTRSKLVRSPGTASARPLILRGAVDNMTAILSRVPRTGRIELNGYRQAHKWNFEFDYRDFPIDPRVVRAIGIEIYLGTVTPDAFQGGVRGEQQSAERGAPLRSLIQTSTAAGIPQNLVFIGVADSIHSSFTNGHAIVTMEGRDQRGIFLDPPYVGPAMFGELDFAQPINLLVEQILSYHPLAPDIIVTVNNDDWITTETSKGTGGLVGAATGVHIPSVGEAGKMTRPNLGAAGNKPAMATSGNANQILFWDIITQYCYLVGAIPYFDYSLGGKPRLVIRPVRSLYDHKRAGIDPRIKTPFASGAQREIRTDSGKEALSVRRMVYGRDVAELSFERKLQGSKPHVVEVVCTDTSSKERGGGKVLTARWPDDGDAKTKKAKVTSVAPSGAVTVSDITYVPVHGVNDKVRLREIAKAIYEEIGRGEMGGKVSTKDLSSFGGTNEDADILRLRPGDPVQLLVDTRAIVSRPPLASELTDHARRSFDEEVAELTAKLGDQNVARVLVACARNAVVELQTYFRVENVSFGWDVKSGVSVDFDFKNYVEARCQVDDDRANTSKPTDVVVGKMSISPGGTAANPTRT